MHKLPRPEGMVRITEVDQASGIAMQRSVRAEEVRLQTNKKRSMVERFPIEAAPIHYHTTRQ